MSWLYDSLLTYTISIELFSCSWKNNFFINCQLTVSSLSSSEIIQFWKTETLLSMTTFTKTETVMKMKTTDHTEMNLLSSSIHLWIYSRKIKLIYMMFTVHSIVQMNIVFINFKMKILIITTLNIQSVFFHTSYTQFFKLIVKLHVY